MICPYCQKEMTENHGAVCCPFCGKDLPPGNVGAPEEKFPLAWFLPALLLPPLVTLIGMTIDSSGEAPLMVTIWGGVLGGAVCGAVLGSHFARNLAARIYKSFFWAMVMIPVCFTLCFFGCTAAVLLTHH